MPAGAASRARTLAEGVRLLVQPLSAPDQAIADAVVHAVEDATPILIDYLDVGGHRRSARSSPTTSCSARTAPTSPDGAGCARTSGSSAWTASTRCSRCRASFEQPVREVGVEDYETRTPAWE